jgi:hypothetical protein
MTVVSRSSNESKLDVVSREFDGIESTPEVLFISRKGRISASLTVGANVDLAKPLRSNASISNTGVIPHGDGMVLTETERTTLELNAPIKKYLNGKDLLHSSRNMYVIDCYGLSVDTIRERFPKLFQWLLLRVKPFRDANRDKDLREKWWLHRRNNESMRLALANLPRFIATVLTAKHRIFTFIASNVLPDQVLVTIGSDSSLVLGVLSSRIHVIWAVASGGWLGVGNDPRYNKTRCFETFPFPVAGTLTDTRIAELAEQLDAHRKRQLEKNPTLTMTGMYNVLEKLRSGEALTSKEKIIHEQGLVSVLKQIHDDLDAAVFEAYGWPTTLTDEASSAGCVPNFRIQRRALASNSLSIWTTKKATRRRTTIRLTSERKAKRHRRNPSPKPQPTSPSKRSIGQRVFLIAFEPFAQNSNRCVHQSHQTKWPSVSAELPKPT